jgi:hypothetical protein
LGRHRNRIRPAYAGRAGRLADLERDLIRTRTTEGRERARAEGRHLGRKPILSPTQQAEAVRRRQEGAAYKELAESYNVAIRTIAKAVKQQQARLVGPPGFYRPPGRLGARGRQPSARPMFAPPPFCGRLAIVGNITRFHCFARHTDMGGRIGCDIMPEYVEITLDRLKRLAAGTLKMRPMGKPVARPPMSGAPDAEDLSLQIEMF